MTLPTKKTALVVAHENGRLIHTSTDEIIPYAGAVVKGNPGMNPSPSIWAGNYSRLGWSIIPLPPGKKEPRFGFKWKYYQDHRPSEANLAKWFNGKPSNMGLMLGPVSGGLTCRDFDKAEAYDRWKGEYPELAAILPTVKTARGYHVYFKSDFVGMKVLDGSGELRGKGCYCLIPPSIHPEGPVYEWVVSPENEIPKIDDFFLLFSYTKPFTEHIQSNTPKDTLQSRTEHTEQNRALLSITEHTEAIVSASFSKENDASSIEQIFQRTLPTEPGTRNHRIFELARELKSIPGSWDADPDAYLETVKQWWARAEPYITTKDFVETWTDFVTAWERIKYETGKGPLMAIFEDSLQMEVPQELAAKYPMSPKLYVLANLCKTLQQESGDNPFFLSCRTAGKLLGMSHMIAHAMLKLLVHDGYLEVIALGGTKENPRKASRYRYHEVRP